MFVKNNETPVEPKPAPNSYTRYDDASGDFGGKELQYSLWYVRHKALLYRILFIGLIVVASIEWLYVLVSGGVYAVVGWQRERALTTSLTQFQDYTQFDAKTSPQSVAVLGTYILSGGVKKIDAVSDVVNPNKQFVVSFDYYFEVDGVKTPVQRATLLPEAEQLLAALGLAEESYPGDASLRLENFVWQRVRPQLAPQPKLWQDERLGFEVKNFVYIPAESADSAKTNVVQFDYFNNTAYSYAEPHFMVGLYAHDTLVGVLPLTLPSFVTFETKKVDLRTLVNNLSVDEVKVFPAVNVYEQSAYLPPPSK